MTASLASRLGAEAVATFILVLIGPGAAVIDRTVAHGMLGSVGVAFAFFFALIAAIGVFAPVSGAHLNPAVTIGFASIRLFPLREVVPYIVAQCTGAVTAAFLLRAIFGDLVIAAATVPSIPIAAAFCVELLFSAVLMTVILRVSADPRVTPALATLAVSATVGGMALFGSLTGSSMNPARTLGPALASGVWRAHWIYWAAPIVGMVSSARVFAWITCDSLPLRSAREAAFGIEGRIGDSSEH